MKLFSTRIFISIIFFCFTIEATAQQNRNYWRVGVGVGNQYIDGKLTGSNDFQKDGIATLDTDFLVYTGALEYMPSLAWGIKLQGISSASFNKFANADLLFTYYTDNRSDFDRESFLAPYVNFGVGNDFINEELYLPLGLGLKFRLGDRFNLNLEYSARSYFAALDNNFDFKEDVSGLAQVSLHFNFGSRADNFRAPTIYTSDSYNYVEDVLRPLSADSLNNPLLIQYNAKLDTSRQQKEVIIPVSPVKPANKKNKVEKENEKPYSITIINNNSFTITDTPNGYQIISDSGKVVDKAKKVQSFAKSDTLLIKPDSLDLKSDSTFNFRDSLLQRNDSIVYNNDSLSKMREKLLVKDSSSKKTDSLSAARGNSSFLLGGRNNVADSSTTEKSETSKLLSNK